MAAQALNGGVASIHKTLSTTVADLVTISGVGNRAVNVTNRDAAQALWAKRVPTSGSAAITAAADGATFIAPGKTEVVQLAYDNSGQAYLSIVGSSNAYSVSL